MNRPITVHRRNMSDSRAMRRLIVDAIRGRDSAARSNDFEGLGEDGGGGGGSCVDFAGTLTGRLQWGHSTISRALLSSTEMLSVHQGQTKWIATRGIQSHCAVRRKAYMKSLMTSAPLLTQSKRKSEPGASWARERPNSARVS